MPSTVFNMNKVPQGLGLNRGYRARVFTGTGTVLNSHTLGYTVPFLTVCRFYHGVWEDTAVVWQAVSKVRIQSRVARHIY